MMTRWDCVEHLHGHDKAAMLALLQEHFSGVSVAQFSTDLSEKQAVVRLFDGTTLRGFSTLAYARLTWDQTEIGAVWSGDTIVDPCAWNVASWPKTWTAAVQALHQQRGRLAWCLICSGVRTFRFMPSCCQHFAPQDRELLPLRDHLAQFRYGTAYHAGIVRLQAPQCLREHLAAIPPHLARDRHVQLFLQHNPGHVAGDELVCASWLEPDNLTRLGRAWWGV